MADTTPEPTLEESLQQILPTLPAPVREFLTGSELANTAQKLTIRYSLHIDQGAVIERELMLVLMGIEEPGELAQTLHDELGLVPDLIQSILTDINKDVFQPLQDKMRKASKEAAIATASAAPATSAPAAVTAAPVPAQAVPQGARDLPAPANLPGADAAPPADTNISMQPAAPASAPEQVVRYMPPQPSQPSAPASQPMPQTPATQTTPAPTKPIVKEYASDPYHEPIEP